MQILDSRTEFRAGSALAVGVAPGFGALIRLALPALEAACARRARPPSPIGAENA